ncbi:MAG: OB-fold domain-containing protein [Proteobacteria bacterium]|nr:OB-fold domain-containing protein [Pseudomonadota bacterium]
MDWLGAVAPAAAAGERAICNWDEDALTLAAQAARNCLLNAGDYTRVASSVKSLSFASTTLPFADRSNSTLLATALDLPADIQTADLTGSLRAGTSALLDAPGGAPRLVVAADARLAKPGSTQELEFGAGAVALLVGGESGAVEPIATLLSAAHLAADFVDHYRMQGERFDYSLEERWIRDEALSKQLPVAIARAVESAGLAAGQIDHVVMTGSAANAKRVARLTGLEKGKIQDNLREGCGDTGTAHALLLLSAALETATPGQHILVVGFGQGVDALVVKVRRPARPTVSEALARKKTEPYYNRYLSHSGLLEPDFGMRAERDNRSAHSVAWRKHRQLTAFIGGGCRNCGTVQFPKSRVCVNPECRATDTQSDHPLALAWGRVKSFTEDWQAYSPRPPAIYGNVEFESGGNLLMELTDVDAGEVGVGMRVGFAFRIKDVDRLRGFKRYFWKAVQV